MVNWSKSGTIYENDLIIENASAGITVVVKEWTQLLHSGADVYLLRDDKQIFLGNTEIVNENYYFFKGGEYEIIKNDDNTLTFRWAISPGDNKENWKEKRF